LRVGYDSTIGSYGYALQQFLFTCWI